MDEFSTSIEDIINRLNGKNSNTMATSTPMKRNNPYLNDKPDDVKKRKIEQPAGQSAVQTKQYFPIASLKPMFSCPEIKGTLTEVSDWLVAQSQAKFLVFRLRDESGEIKGLAFDPMGADFHKNFKLGATVILKNSKVAKEGNKPDGSETYKLIVNRYSSIKIENVSPAPLKPARKMIRDVLDNSNEREVIDVLGILEDVSEMERNLMREIRIVDESEANIILTLWDNAAKNFNAPLGSVIAAYRVAVRIYNSSKLLRTCHLTKLLVDPPIDETQRLKRWHSEWTAAKARENENSMLMENTVQRSNNSIIDNRKTEIVDSVVPASTSMQVGNYISVEAVLKSPAGAIINIVGFVLNQEPPVQQQTRSGKSRWMKTVMLTDRKHSVIELAIWGDEVKDHDIPTNSTIAATNVTVRDFDNNKTLSCLWSNLQIETKVPQTAGLRINIPNYSTSNEMENSVIAGSSRPPGNSLNLGDITSIKEIKETANAGSKHNIVALVTKCGQPEEQQTKSGKKSWMRTVMLIDDKDSEIEMAVWGFAVKSNDIPLHSVIMAKNVTVRDFNNDKTLSCLWAHLQIEPNVPQVARLRNLISTNSVPNEIENSVMAGTSKSPNNSLYCQKITSIKEIKDTAMAGSKHDIVALVTKCGPPEEQQTKAGKRTWMRAIMLMDDEDSEIELAVWGEAVKSNDIPLHSVIMARNVTVREFNNDKTLTCLWTHLQIEPNVPQAERLKNLILTNSATNENENYVIAGSSISPNNSLHCQNIASIKEIKDTATAGSRHNIVALVTKCGPPEEQQTRAGKRMWMRILMLMDDEDSEVEMAVWGDPVKDNDIPLNSVIMVRNVTVREFNDEKTFSCLWIHLQIEPNVPQAVSVRKLISKNSAKNETENAVIAESSKSSGNFLLHTDITPITEIRNMATAGSKYNIVALVTKSEPPVEQQTKAGKRTWMRVIMLMDDEDSNIEMAVWGDPVKDNDIPLHSVIMARNVTVREFNDDKTLTCLWMHFQIEPNVPQAVRLRELIPKISATDDTENAVIAESSRSRKKCLDCKNIKSIKEIKEMATCYSKYDIVALVTKCKSPEEQQTRAGKSKWMRVIMLMDDKDSEIEMSVWGNDVKVIRIPRNSVIMARNVTVRDYNGYKTLSCLWADLQIEPNVPQAIRLRKLIPKKSVTNEMENAIIAVSSKSPDNSLDCKSSTTIKEIKDTATAGSKYNIVALVTKCEPPEEQEYKGGRRTWMRVVTLMDDEDSKIEMTIWGGAVKANNIPLHSVIMARNATVREFNDNKTLRCLWIYLEIEPKIPQAAKLRNLIPKNSATNETENAIIAGSSKSPDNSLDCKNFTSLKEIKDSVTSGSKYDIVALVTECGPPEEQQTKNGKKSWMRVVVLMDGDNSEMEMTIWGNEVKINAIPLHSVIMARHVTVRAFNDDKTLSCFWSNLHIDPDIPQAARLMKLIKNSSESETEEFADAGPSEINRDSESQEDFAAQEIVFTPIREIKSEEMTESTCNIVGIVLELESPKKEKTEAGTDSYKRVVIISDQPYSKIALTIWGEEVTEREIPLHSVIVAHVEIEQSNDDKTLKCLWMDLEINPNIPEADEIAKIFADHRYAAKKHIDSSEFDSVERIMEETGRISKWNLIGIVKKTEPSMQLDSSLDEDFWFTKVKLKDAEENRIELVVWSDESLDSEIPLNSILAVKGAEARMVGDRVALGAFWHLIKINPDISEAQRLKQVRKKDWDFRWPNFRENVDSEVGDYTPIDMIRRWNRPGDCVNTIGLVVEVNPPKEWENRTGSTYFIRKCVLRGRNGTEIQLTIFSNLSNPFEMPLNSVIAVKDATLKHTEDKKKLALSCRIINVDFDIDIPETEGFKEAALNDSARFESPEDQDPNNFTAIKDIKETRPLGSIINVLGLIVDVIKRKTMQMKAGIQNVRVTLMDMDNELITLIIKKTPVADNHINVHSVIAARDATLRQCGDDKVLWCLRRNVEINPRIPEAERRKFNELNRIPFVRDFMPFKTILHERSLVDCTVDIIGEVIQILPPGKTRNSFGQMRFVHPFILRNEVDLKLNIWGPNELNSSLNKDNVITVNTIIIVKSALVEFQAEEISVSVENWSNVKINPQISEHDRGAKSLCIVAIKRIIEEAKVGEKIGILAVVRNPPVKIFGGGNSTDSSEDSDEENRKMRKNEPGMECAKLIDSSGGTINMTMPFSVAKAVRKSIEKTVVIRARNVQVCEYEGDLELACTTKASRVEINPTTKEAKELLKWYDVFCKKEKDEKEKEEQRELPIIPINLLIENWADKTRASVMGILIASQIYKVEESDLQFETRRIQIIDESEEVINILLWNFAAKDFDVPLYSIILVQNFYVYAEDEIKCGNFGPGTEYKIITAAGKYLKATQRLESWFAHYCAQSENLTNSSDESDNGEENSITLLNIIKVAKNQIILPNDIEMVESSSVSSNDIEMIESPTVLQNDSKMAKSPTVSSNDIEMIESPTVLSNNSKMAKSPTVSSNDIEKAKSPTVLENDSKMAKSPTVSSNDIEKAKSPTVSSNDIKKVKSPTVLANDIEMVKSPSFLENDTKMVKSPTISSNDIKMVESPIVLSSDSEMMKSPIVLSNDTGVIESKTVLSNVIKMMKNPIVLSNNTEMTKSPIVLSNDTGMIESPTVSSNDAEMTKSPTVLSNDIKMMKSPIVLSSDTEMIETQIALSSDTEMIESPTVLSNDIKIGKSPTVLQNDSKMVESPIILSNDIEMVKSPTVLSGDVEMVESSQKIGENREIFFGNDCFLSQQNEGVLDSSTDSDSPDIFADC